MTIISLIHRAKEALEKEDEEGAGRRLLDRCALGRFEKWLQWKNQIFQMNLLLTHKSKTIGNIAEALRSNTFCESGIFLFYLLGLVSEVTILQ